MPAATASAGGAAAAAWSGGVLTSSDRSGAWCRTACLRAGRTARRRRRRTRGGAPPSGVGARSVQGGVDRPLAGGLDLGLGLGAADPLGALDRLARLEVLVGLEEVLDLQPVELGHVVDVLQVRHPGVRRRDGEDLVVP